ncbi:hypothetical protein [Clostridiisalibacter paucivorans]|uniref:hypothetical protein n=1 Tax=Clostridiisalibacter paucivorans TaxID=408753 RepID=UPI00047C0612|nr:hypothetical protein [Clostridiisalibacter paucivorans]
MLKDLNELFDEMVFMRLDDIGDNELLKNHEYCNLRHNLITLYKAIKNRLPEEYRHYIDDYESIQERQNELIRNIIYEQGIKDGMRLEFERNKVVK